MSHAGYGDRPEPSLGSRAGGQRTEWSRSSYFLDYVWASISQLACRCARCLARARQAGGRIRPLVFHNHTTIFFMIIIIVIDDNDECH